MDLKSLIIFWGLLAFLGIAGAAYTAVPDALSYQPATRKQFGEVTQEDPDPQAGLVDWTVAVCGIDGSIFRFVVLHDTTIKTLLFVQQKEAASIPVGKLLEGSGPSQYDMPRRRQPDPKAIAMTKSTIEACDGSLEFIKKDLQYY